MRLFFGIVLKLQCFNLIKKGAPTRRKVILSLHLVENIGVQSRRKSEAELLLVCAFWLEPVVDSNSGVF